MPSLESIQPKIAKGYGKAGSATGQLYDVYRLHPGTTGSVVQASNYVTSVRASFQRYTAKANVEAHYFIKVPVFEAYLDPTNFKIGDVFVERTTQKYTDGSAFTYAFFRPLRYQESQAVLFVQTPIPATITRSESNPTHAVNGRVPYQGMNKSTEMTLVLINGGYSFKPAGQYPPAAVYLGLSALANAGDQPRPDLRLPTEVPRQSWDVYTALLPGIQLVESDIVNAANGDRYYMRTIYMQYVGLQGYQLSCYKVRV